MTRPRLGAWLACGLLGVTLSNIGCGSSSSNSPNTNPNTTTAAAVQTAGVRFADTYCTALVNCSCMDSANLANCKFQTQEAFSMLVVEMSVKSPGVQFDQARFDACMADATVAFQACPATFDVASCQNPSGEGMGFFVGAQASGKPCHSSRDCASGLACDSTQRICQPAKAAGESCLDVACQAGLYCNTVTHVCAQQGATASAACDHTQSESCVEGLTCITTDTCAAPHAVGENCTDGAGCVKTAYSDGSSCIAKKAAGEACTGDSQCLSDECSSNSKCAVANFCTNSLFGH